ncbi:hypothetical protein Avbf_02854 [Armadillidium vulgare]|nr:hypothetical protein Avbf_02854 [Armadillidium vulgare]
MNCLSIHRHSFVFNFRPRLNLYSCVLIWYTRGDKKLDRPSGVSVKGALKAVEYKKKKIFQIRNFNIFGFDILIIIYSDFYKFTYEAYRYLQMAIKFLELNLYFKYV